MPATTLTLYPGSTYDLTYDGGGFSWTSAPSAALINDGEDVANDPTFGLFTPANAAARTAYAEFRLASIPIGIVSITSIRLVAWLMATGTGGTYNTDVSAMVRPAGNTYGASGAYFSTAVVLPSLSSALEVFNSYAYAAWTVNPESTLAWTKSDLAALAFGLRLANAGTGVTLASIKLGRLRMIVEGTSIPANTEAKRTLLSMPLRLFGRGLERVKIKAPAAAADIGMGETFFLEHNRGRRAAGPGWGPKQYERAPLLCTQKAVDLISGEVGLDSLYRRQRYTRLWLPGLTTLGHSLEALGLPILHSGGGGPVCTRAQVKYIDRPGNPTDNVMQGATENQLAHDYRGMCVESGDEVNLVVNSTFSQGTGDVFDDWTKTESGTGTVTEETARIGVDEVGLRRSVWLNVGVTDSSVATIKQDVAVTDNCRLAVRTYNNYGAGKLACVIQRASDSKYWNDNTETWDVAIAYNRIGNDTTGGFREWLSEEIVGGADTLTVEIGYFGEAGSVVDGIGFQAYAWSVDLIEDRDHVGTPIITTTTVLARVAEVVAVQNNAVGRAWGHELGGFSGVVGFIPLWNSADIAASQVRVIEHIDYGNNNYAQIAYQKNTGGGISTRFVFSIFSDGIAYTAEKIVEGDVDLDPVRGRVVKLSYYWISAAGELGRTPGEINIAVNDEWGTPDIVEDIPPEMDAVSTIYIGHAWQSEAPIAWCDGFVRHLDHSPLVLRDEELERKPA